MSKNFLWGFNSIADKTLCTCACFEAIPNRLDKKMLAGAIIVISKFDELLFLFVIFNRHLFLEYIKIHPLTKKSPLT